MVYLESKEIIFHVLIREQFRKLLQKDRKAEPTWTHGPLPNPLPPNFLPTAVNSLLISFIFNQDNTCIKRIIKKSTNTKEHIMKSSESPPTLLNFYFPIPEAKTLHVCLEVNSIFPSNMLFLLSF